MIHFWHPRRPGDFLATLARRAAPALILFAATVAIHWKLTLTNQYTWLDGSDLTRQILPWFQVEAAEIRHLRLPLYDMHQWGGQSLIGQDQPGVLFPLNWLLFLSREWHGRLALQTLNWYFVLIHFLASLFCYLFVRDLGLSVFASLCAGMSFGLSGLMGNLTWPQMLNGGMWTPLVLLFTRRALDDARPMWNIALAGAVTGFAFYSGHHQLPTYTVLAVGTLLLFFVFARRIAVLRAAKLGALYVAFAILIGAPQLLPSFEYWTRALRWVGSANPVGFADKVPYIVFDQFSANPVGLFWLIYPGSFPNAMHYVGLTVVSLAIFAAATQWRNRWVPPMMVLAVAGALFSLGKYSLFHGLLYSAVPLVDKSRSAAYAMFVSDLALGVLAAFGIDALLRQRESLDAPLRRLGNWLLAGGGVLCLTLLVRMAVEGDKVLADIPFSYVVLTALLLGSTVRAWQLGRIPARGLVLAIAGLMLFEIGAIADRDAPHIEEGWNYLYQLSRHDDLAAALHAQPGLFRVEKNDDEITYNFGDWHAVDELRGYAGVTTNVFTMSGERNAGALLGVKYFLGREPHNSETTPMFQGQSGLNIYRVPGAFPRAWTVHAADRIANEAEARQHMNVDAGQLAARTFLLGAPPTLATCAPSDTLEVSETRDMQFVVDAQMACQGMVILGNTYFPGWRAEVDGHSVPIYQAYQFLQGVVVEGGHHRVRFRYRPVAFYWGLALAAAGIGGLLWLRRVENRAVARLKPEH